MSTFEKSMNQGDGKSIVLNRNTLKVFQELEREARALNGKKGRKEVQRRRKNRCTICGKNFVKKAFLKKHMQLHKEFLCTRCHR